MTTNVNERPGVRQWMRPGALSLAAAVAAGMLGVAYLGVAHPDFFEPYFGSLPPLTAFAFVTVLGFISVSFLNLQSTFAIGSREPSRHWE